MKKFFYLATAALALSACSSDEYIGEVNEAQLGSQNGVISFSSIKPGMTRADLVGADAAAVLGNNFIVEGVKCAAPSGSDPVAFSAGSVVFDNYLVGWGANTAGVTADNTNDWKYVGLEAGTTNCPEATWQALHTGTDAVTKQTIKYWDYSADTYKFIAFSTGALQMTNSTPTANTSVQVSKIDKANYSTAAFTFKAAGASDLSKCYYTDVTTVANVEFGAPVKLVFKNMAAKLRVGLYETIPGYAVKDVKFYSAEPTTLGTGSSISTSLYVTGDAKIPTDGTVTVAYNAEGKATATLAQDGASTNTATSLSLGTFAADAIGTTLAGATYSTPDDGNAQGYVAVIPAQVNAALTLKVDYTLVSDDGSNEEINVYGANAVVPANYVNWLPNYAYTYIFKISDNTNGLTNPADTDHEGLFPITFDAVVADITAGVTGEQTTVTTVATPSVTTYQKDHTKGSEYAAGDIYVQVMKEGALQTITTSKIYTVPEGTTEAQVIDALQMGTTDTNGNIAGRNNITLSVTPGSSFSDYVNFVTNVTTIPGADGKDISVAEGSTAKFSAKSGKTYVFVYDYTSGTPTATPVYSYDATVSKLSVEPTDWATVYTSYYTMDASGNYVAATTDWSATTSYYKKFENNNRSYAVKVIKVQ